MNALPPRGLVTAGDVADSRFREAGDVTLDWVHRDGRVAEGWLGLDPHEFALLWRLAKHPGERVTRAQLLADVVPTPFAAETGRIAVDMPNLCAKLDAFGLSQLVAGDDDEGYVLDARSWWNL